MVKQSFALIIFFFGLLHPQAEKIENKQRELDSLRAEIEKLEQHLASTSSKEKKTFALLDAYNKKAFLLSRLIGNLKREEKQKDVQIRHTSVEIDSLSSQLKRLQEYYTAYIIGVYKKINRSKFEYVFNASSINQAVTRYRYLRSFSDRGRREVERMSAIRADLDTLKRALQIEKTIKQNIIRVKTKEEISLAKQQAEKKQTLAQLKKNKSALQKELEAKKIAEQKIRNLINQLIAKAREKKKAAEQTAKTSTEKETKISGRPLPPSITERTNVSTMSNFSGRLYYPVAGGVVIRKYGESRNEKLNTVTINYGIDIRTGTGAAVRASADGEVSAIEWIPGYGTVIILTHENDVRTVYGRISGVTVREGEKVTTGAVIGSVNESLEGNILHYELWSERHSQNPEAYLRRR